MDVFCIVFSDIDGTILDFQNYSYEKSLPAIQKLAGRGIPLVLTSSKTYAEIQKLQQKLSLHHPFIFENGAGIALHGSYTLLGKNYHQLSAQKPIVQKYCPHIQWAESMSTQQLLHYTGLPHSQLQDMMNRMASLLFSTQQSIDIASLNTILLPHGIAITTGGKFYTVTDSCVNKGIAVQKVIQQFMQEHTRVYSYAIGDGINDLQMFHAVDRGFFVGNDSEFSFIQIHCNNVYKTHAKGPAGFAEAVEYIVNHSVF